MLLNLVNHNGAFTINKTPIQLSLMTRSLDVSSYNEIDDDDANVKADVISVDRVTQETTNDEFIDVAEPPIAPPSILFYTGKLKTALPSDIYNSFLNKLSNKRKIYIASSDLDKNIALVNEITSGEKVTVISHSTSASDALELVKHMENAGEETEDNIENLILIDPIDHYYFKNDFNMNQYNVFKYLDKMEDMEEQISTFIEADKLNLVFKSIFKPGNHKNKKINKKTLVLKSSISNRWKIFPPIPPINKYSLNLNQLKNKKVKTVENFGHFDILDPTWSNMVHNTFSRGASSREVSNLENYYDILVEHIDEF